ncbi:MAG: M42 family metallopeptidase [Treponema sp.]|nr:M42 family metallopeptidase [Treponema sp.]
MDKNTTIELIKELSNAPGISGFEDAVLEILRRRGEGLGDWSEDAMRNLYLRRFTGKEGQPVVMLDAHSDEVGFMVKTIKPNGMLEFIPIGGWVSSNLGAQKVLVRNDLGQWLTGIIASKPPHFLSEADKKLAPEITSMMIDLGASSDKEIREDYKISIAAPVAPDVSFSYREENDIMTGKAFDDRLGCAAVISVLKELSGENLNTQVTGAFASQEEVGLRGATVTVQRVKPDIAISFEGTPADDTTADSYAIQTAIKKGPMLRHIDSRMITNPRFQRFALDTARENNIMVQEAIRAGGATNGGVIHLAGKAVPVIVIGIPARYIHSHNGIASYSDYENSVKLACEIIRSLNEKIIAGF